MFFSSVPIPQLIGSSLAQLVWIASALASAAKPRVVLTCATNQAGQYQKIEFILQATGNWTNPCNADDVSLQLELVAPSGKRITLPAFWYQRYERRRLGVETGSKDWMYPVAMPEWRARFAPIEVGVYRAKAQLKDAGGTAQSQDVEFQCLPSQRKGFLGISRKDPRFFEFSGGEPFFALGQNLAFIGSQQYVTLSKAEQIFGELAANGANYARIWACCEDWAMAIEARKSAFGRSWDWHPRFTPLPGSQTRRNCLQLTAEHRQISVEPSHPVAVRSVVRYRLSGKVRLEQENVLEIDIDTHKTRVTSIARQPVDWQPFQFEFQTSSNQQWLGPFEIKSDGPATTLVGDLSLREESGGPELLWEADPNREAIGTYNPLDCFLLDQLVTAAEQNGIFLQVCLLTRDLYMDRLKEPASPQYAQAIREARNTVRYAVARWGYSTSIAAWEYWNEMDPRLPTERFYSSLGEYLQQADPYRHLRTTSTWGPSVKDCRHGSLDIADVHFYLRPADKERLADEVDAVIDRTCWLRAQAPAKPAHLGEFGLANDRWQPTEEMKRSNEIVDFHNALWASALSGASGTAMFWWWERLDQRGAYREYRPLSRFISDLPWTSGEVAPAVLNSSEPRLRAIGLQTRDSAWLWLFNRAASWANTVIEQLVPGEISSATLELKNLADGAYRVEWYDTRSGHTSDEQDIRTHQGKLNLGVPTFRRDVACRVVHVGP